MKILFLTDDREDYLADSLLHGLVSLERHSVIDYPRKDIMYRNSFPEQRRSSVYGRGFTLYGLLAERYVDRSMIWQRLEDNEFDLIVIGSIWRQFGLLNQLSKSIARRSLPIKVALLDGDDDARFYPWSSSRLREFGIWPGGLSRSCFAEVHYFKRELDLTNPLGWIEMLLPRRLRVRARNISVGNSVKVWGCSFSIPEELIQAPDLSKKKKRFPMHIVDEEVVEELGLGRTSYAFESQGEYYKDLSESKFGITTKRGGWDCLRHYEIAAAGTVPCFRRLEEKPAECAPHGLNKTNSVSYKDHADLACKIKRIDDAEYKSLLESTHEWVKKQTTKVRAANLLECIWGNL